MFIAADVGGTHVRLALYSAGPDRPVLVARRDFPTRASASFEEVLTRFLAEVAPRTQVTAAGIAVAGPVIAQRAQLTNVPWVVGATSIATHLGTARVRLLNDLEALAVAIPVLTASEYLTLQEGTPDPEGNAAVIAAGTGLGTAFLPRVDGRLRVLASEGGHADFAARTDRELELTRFLTALYGRAQVEHVLSGPGLRTLHAFTHRDQPCAAGIDSVADDTPGRVSEAGLAGRCAPCAEALELFVNALGAEAGNLALRGTATAGVYVGGGIAPKILPALRSGSFLDAFLAKAPMTSLVARMPVHVIVNEDAGLLGAAVSAVAQAV